MVCRACGHECADYEFRCPHCGLDPHNGTGDDLDPPAPPVPEEPVAWDGRTVSDVPQSTPPPTGGDGMLCPACSGSLGGWEHRCPHCGAELPRERSAAGLRGVRDGVRTQTFWRRNWKRILALIPLLLLLWLVIIPLLRSNKPVKVVLLVDASGSMMSHNKLPAAKDAARRFVDELENQDYVAVVAFDSRPREMRRLGKVRGRRDEIRASIDAIPLGGETDILRALRHAEDLLIENRAWLSSTQKYAIVLLSDGVDTASWFGPQFILRAEQEDMEVRIFAIAYGVDADLPVLQALASQSGGEAYRGTPENLGEIYEQIARKY